MDDKLSRALRSLPRERARPGFTDRVLRRLEEPAKRPRLFPAVFRRPLLAAAVLLVFAVGGRGWWLHFQQQQHLARLASIESERRALLSELESIQRQVAEARPLVYLGGSNDIDVVVDLEHLRQGKYRLPDRLPFEPRTPEGRTPDVRLASFNPESRTIY